MSEQRDPVHVDAAVVEQVAHNRVRLETDDVVPVVLDRLQRVREC